MTKKKIHSEEGTKRKEHPLARFLGVLFTAICAFVIGWLVKDIMPDAEQGLPAGLLPAEDGEPLVRVERAGLKALNPPVDFIGRVEPVRDVDLGARVSGYVTKVNFKEGASVEEGDLLFEIDLEPYEAVVALRKAELAQVEAEVERAERYLKRLNASDARGITQADMDKAESDVAAGRAGVVQAQASVRMAEIDLKHCRIHAPISGKTGRAVATVGDYVAPSIGTLVRIVQMDPIRVVFSMTDREYFEWRDKISHERLWDTMRLRLRLPNGKIPDLSGEPDFENNEMSGRTANLSIRIRFSNTDGLLVPNSYVTVMIDEKDPHPYPVISQSALHTNSDGDFVYVLAESSKVVRRKVKTGDTFKGAVELMEGVKDGEKVVVEGVLNLSDGVKVRVDEEMPSHAGRHESVSITVNDGAAEI
ncbi:MAG: efflux RND transporter periplasmic adaptor subunit [Kiritimatiellia bacterium]